MNAQTRDRYAINSLIEEAITSSQLEGAVSTREVAREMLKSGRKPRDRSEQMILNNFSTMQEYIKRKSQELLDAEANLTYLKQLNYRQQAAVVHAMRHPQQEYSIASHRRSHNVAYATARSDLQELEQLGLLSAYKRGKALFFKLQNTRKGQKGSVVDF